MYVIELINILGIDRISGIIMIVRESGDQMTHSGFDSSNEIMGFMLTQRSTIQHESHTRFSFCLVQGCPKCGAGTICGTREDLT